MSHPGSTRELWTAADVPDQAGRTAVITGANSGIGFEAARVLATRGAAVVLACRDAGKAKDAAARIATTAPQAMSLNATGLPPRGVTADGFELQFGTNHLGHFALTGLLLDRLLPVPGSRVVTVSSNGHRAGRINFADLQSERSYRRMSAYGQSKLANLLFCFELQGRAVAAGTAMLLAGLTLERGAHAPDFRQRRECCREECVRRGAPQLYEFAEDIVSPHAA